MDIGEYVKGLQNYPVLFCGAGVCKRYFTNTYDWKELLKAIYTEIGYTNEDFWQLLADNIFDDTIDFPRISGIIEEKFNNFCLDKNNRNGKFKSIIDKYFINLEELNKKVSMFKMYIAKLLSNYDNDTEKTQELLMFKKASKKISSIITTNYDTFIEDTFDFNPLIGNDIVLSNPYGSVYKIHGSVNEPENMIITRRDYELFEDSYELIKAQLLSLFIHNPIVFIGYKIGDDNIKSILNTVYKFIKPNTELSKKIQKNFLIVEYEKGSTNLEISDYDLKLEKNINIRINKLKTDNYIAVFEAIANITLPVSVLDIRKVQNIIKEISSGGDFKVQIATDLDTMSNSDKVLIIGNQNKVTYNFKSTKELLIEYFTVIENKDSALIKLIDKQIIQDSQYYPIFGFSKICSDLECASKLKKQQIEKLRILFNDSKINDVNISSLKDILDSSEISKTYKHKYICKCLLNGKITIDDVEDYLKNNYEDTTNYKKILCAYDYVMYSETNEFNCK